jgi:hypothetical protein
MLWFCLILWFEYFSFESLALSMIWCGMVLCGVVWYGYGRSPFKLHIFYVKLVNGTCCRLFKCVMFRFHFVLYLVVGWSYSVWCGLEKGRAYCLRRIFMAESLVAFQSVTASIIRTQ